MIITFFVSLVTVSYLLSGVISWLALLRNISHQPSFSCWKNILFLFASLMIVFIWPIWIIIEAKRSEKEETVVPGLA